MRAFSPGRPLWSPLLLPQREKGTGDEGSLLAYETVPTSARALPRTRPDAGRGPRAALLALATVVALVLSVQGTGVALAHAVLLRSDPAQNGRLTASPAKVDLFFSEPLDHKFSTVLVQDTTGARQDKHDVGFTSDATEMTVSLPTLHPGFYTVNWTTVSATDGHRLQGTFPFTILNPDGSTPSGTPPVATASGGSSSGIEPVDSLLRWLLLLGLMGVTAGFGFAAFVLYPAAGMLEPEERRRGRGFALWLLGGVVPAAALVAAVINLAALLRQAAIDGSLSAVGTLLSGKTGTYWLAREGLIVLAGALGWLLSRREQRPESRPVYAGLAVGLLAGLGALLTMSLTSHAAAGSGTAWAVPSDFLHLAGVSLWLGSVAQLPALLWIQRSLDGEARTRLHGQALRRFSTLAVLCVGLVLLSGTFNALVQVPSLAAMKDTAYGRALTVKLILVVPLLGLGLLNAAWIARRFERRALAADPDAPRAASSLARSAVLESVAGVLVIAAAAVLVFFVPAKDAVAQNTARQVSTKSATVTSVYRNQAPTGDLSAALTVAPNRVGDNDFRVLLTGPDADKVERVQLRFQFTSQSVGGSAVTADPVSGTPGLYDAKAANFSFVGLWKVTINVRRAGHDDVNGAFTVEVPDVTGATTSATFAGTGRSITAFPAHGITQQQAWGAVLIAAGAALFLFRRRIWAANQWLGTAGVFGISGAVIVGLVVVVAGAGAKSGQAAFVQNPVPADTRSVDSGKALFAANCGQCHGSTGHGDGPSAAALNPKPFDLTVHVGLHPDFQLFYWITNGIPRTGMPAWKGQLDATQRWDLVNYLRTLSPAAGEAPVPAPSATAAAAPAR